MVTPDKGSCGVGPYLVLTMERSGRSDSGFYESVLSFVRDIVLPISGGFGGGP